MSQSELVQNNYFYPMGKKETLCKWHKEDIKKDFEQLVKLVREPRYICKKCGRATNDKEAVCKPVEL